VRGVPFAFVDGAFHVRGSDAASTLVPVATIAATLSTAMSSRHREIPAWPPM
jgi:hypothetical protein